MKKFYQLLYGREYELREQIFRMITLVGSVMVLLGIIESVILMDVNLILLPLFILLVVLGIALLATFKYRRIDFAAIIVALLIIFMVFPLMFFLSGGLEGGAPIWFALGLFYVFLMFSGKRLYFFLILSLLVDVFVYGYNYYHPELIMPMDSRASAYLDSLFAVLAVGLSGGAILKVQNKLFSMERSVAQKQQEELEHASASKNNFFASMSHEIRTPINTIIGLNEMILRESNEEGTRDYALNIQNASKMLLSLVNDILDLSQLEMKRMEIVPLEYKTVELFGNLIDMIQVRLREKKLEFQVDIDENIPSLLLGDMKRINQVVLNILTNAAKYTTEGSITFSVHAEAKQGEQIFLKISVADTGIGIRKEDLQHLYDSFKRVDARRNLKVEGSGLGLSITKQLVDRMGGEIMVDSIYTKGSTFTILLPQKILDHTPIGNVPFLSRSKGIVNMYQQSFEAPEARVLIVDDNVMNAMVESKLLQETKVQIDIATSGAECLEMTKRKYYHVILMDYRMPEMDGVQTLKQLRKQENGLCRDSAVIILSASSANEAAQGFGEAGVESPCYKTRDKVESYLEKPVSGMALEAEILKFLPEDIVEYCQEPEESASEMNIQRISRYKKRKVYITTDCVSDMPSHFIEKYDIGLMYLYIRTESGRFADTWEISSDNLNRYMTDVKSSARTDRISVEEYEGFYAEALDQAEQVIHISMAKHVGQSYQTAVMAAQSFDHVHVINSSQISCGQALVVLYAGKLAMEGYSAEEICEKVQRVKKRIESHFIMPAANIFYQNGFTNSYTAKVCQFFGFHPILKVSQSRLNITGVRVGNIQNAWKRFIRWHLLRKGRISTDIVFISHVGCSVEQQEFIRREVLRCIPFKKVIIQKASVTIACNSGIGTFGLAYYTNSKEEGL